MGILTVLLLWGGICSVTAFVEWIAALPRYMRERHADAVWRKNHRHYNTRVRKFF